VTHAARTARFFGGEFMGRSFLVRSFATFTGNLALALGIHGGESTVFGAGTLFVALVA
jgi:hypothetical protein